MPGTVASVLVAQVRDEFVFDADDTQILRWLNQKHGTMVVDSECLAETISLPVTDGSATIELPDNVVRAQQLLIDGQPYDRASRRDIAALGAGYEQLYGEGGIFVPDSSAAGERTLTVYGTPDPGLSVQIFAAVRPPVLTLGDSVVTPPEFDEALVNGTAAIGFRRDAEQGPVADSLDALFLAQVEKLRRQTRRVARSGPRRIRVEWP